MFEEDYFNKLLPVLESVGHTEVTKSDAEELDNYRHIISENYIRDHLLIQWLIDNISKYIDPVTGSPRIFIENIYEDWIKWFKTAQEEALKIYDEQRS